MTRLLHDRERLALLALPLVLLAIEPDWFYSGPHRDAWVYYGFFANGIAYLQRFQEFYYASRLAVTLPGFVFHHVLPVEAANLALHLTMWWAAVLSFHATVKPLLGQRGAFAFAAAFGLHPYALHALGWNYTDGFGITYFLVALAALASAATSPSPRAMAALGGGAAAALLGVNLFYVVYWPVLFLHAAAVCRARGGTPLRRVAGWALVGGGAVLTIFAAINRVFGGRWLFLQSSLGFVGGRIGTVNPFRDPTYSWVPAAAWLVIPLVAAVGSVVLLVRLLVAGRLRHEPVLASSQAGLLVLVSEMTISQLFGNTGVLQHFFYASLLTPVSFLALAGQSRELFPRAPVGRHRRSAVWLSMLLLASVGLPMAWLGDDPTKNVLPALVTGALALAWVWTRFAAGVRLAAFFVLLSITHLLVRQAGDIFWEFEACCRGEGRALFLQMATAVAAIDRFDPSHRARLWYDVDGPAGEQIDAMATAFLLCPSMVNASFPSIQEGTMCDGARVAPGLPIVVVSTRPSALTLAKAGIESLGFRAHVYGQETFAGPIRGLTTTYLRVDPRPGR